MVDYSQNIKDSVDYEHVVATTVQEECRNINRACTVLFLP